MNGMKVVGMAAALGVLTVAGGCKHGEAVAASNAQQNAAWAAQERSMEVVKMEFAQGVGQQAGTVSITGLTSLSLAVPLTPLAQPPQQKTVAGEVLDAAGKISPYAMGAYLGGKALDNAGGGSTTSSSKVNNNNAAVTGNVTQ